MDIAFRSARQLAGLIRRKRIGCLELLDHYLARVERFNPALNAIIVADTTRARSRARAADRALAKGEAWGPLHGVPMTVKESFDIRGLPTTWGVPAFKDNIAASTALAVGRWLAAGAIVFGKTNVPMLLADSQSWNEIYGATSNPWNRDRTPGGSSGGSAAALAAGLTGIEMGSDIASSIRNPAHYCGVFGHKPTWGLCPPRGHALRGDVAMTDISVIGPLGRSADDLALGLSILAVPDEIEARGLKIALPAPKKEFRDYRVGIVYDDATAPVDCEVSDLLQSLAAFLAKQRVKVSDRARPDLDMKEVHRTFDVMLRAATAGREPDASFAEIQRAASALAADDDAVHARRLRGVTILHRDWQRLNETRHRMRWKWHQFFQDYDLLLCPVMCTAAYPHDHKPSYQRFSTINGKTYPAMMETFWAGYSGVVHLPASVAPIGLTREGLPVGVQIVGPQLGDRGCIQFAHLLEREYRGFVPPPGYDA